MNDNLDTKWYDLFKFIITFILLILLFLMLTRASGDTAQPVAAVPTAELAPTHAPEPTAKPTSVPEPTVDPMAGLPEFPDLGMELTYDPEDGYLYSPDGRALFALNDQTGKWEPLLPPDLAGSLPEGAKLIRTVDGEWQIVGSDGNPLYYWDPDTLSWQMMDVEMPEIELPPFPQSDVDLTYNPEAMTLVTEDGIALFRFDSANMVWEPIVPVDITAELPEGAQVVMGENGEWLILASDGSTLYAWDGGLLSWQMGSPSMGEIELPPFPEADVELTYNEESMALLNPDGQAVYLLDAEIGAWEPVLPPDILDVLPDGSLMALGGDGTWGLFDPDGNLLYSWDPAGLTWVPVEQPVAEPPSQDACPLALPPRLAVGWGAIVTTNLNMRSSPGIANNWITTMPTGTHVDIVGGPECVPHGDGAYLWWQVASADGDTGWSAEASLQGSFYFLEPTK